MVNLELNPLCGGSGRFSMFLTPPERGAILACFLETLGESWAFWTSVLKRIL
jgi:hypothetical protein